MKKLILTICFLCFVKSVFAGGVTDNNNGNKGDIFIHSGVNNGANSVGTWVDSSHFKGEKGDKGDKGEQGVAGNDGINGKDGMNGENGKDGEKGIKGDKGDKGDTGKNGVDGKDSISSSDINNKIDNLESTDFTATGKVRWLDTKKWEFESYLKFSENKNKISEVGVELTYKFGESYIDKKLRELEAKIDKINNIEQVSDSEVYTNGTSSIGIRTKF